MAWIGFHFGPPVIATHIQYFFPDSIALKKSLCSTVLGEKFILLGYLPSRAEACTKVPWCLEGRDALDMGPAYRMGRASKQQRCLLPYVKAQRSSNATNSDNQLTIQPA